MRVWLAWPLARRPPQPRGEGTREALSSWFLFVGDASIACANNLACVLMIAGTFRFDPTHSVADERGGIGDFEFLFDVFAMHIDGLGTEAKLFGDGFRGQALADELENLELAVA